MTKRAAEAAYSCDIVTEYSTSANEEVEQEIEMMRNTFDNVSVSGKSTAQKKLIIPIVCQSNAARKVFLRITLVQGYPYLPPHVKLVFPGGLRPGDKNALSESEVAQIRTEVNENIQPCLSSGMPCLMQIASTVSNIVDNGCPVHQIEAASAPAGRKPSLGAASSTPGQSPALTPAPLKAKDALRLSLLTLHVLRKCCHMKNPESKEEANSDFEWLASYLLSSVQVFPSAVREALPWRGEPFARAFARERQQVMQREEQPLAVHPAADAERRDLTKWLWESEEMPLRLQHGTEGRYRSEFIQQRLLGSGGFAPVYVCRKKIDGRLYAIKKVAMPEGQSEKIIREVQTLAALNHKNIVRYYDAWVENGCEEELRRFLDEEGEGEDEEDESGSSEGDGDQSTESDSDSGGDDYSGGRGRARVGQQRQAVPANSPKKPAKAHAQGQRGVYDMVWSSSSSSLETTSSEEEEERSSYDPSETDSSTDQSEMGDTGARRAPCWNDRSPTKEPEGNGRARATRSYQTLYIQMELCSARSLRHLIEEGDVGARKGIFASENGEMIAAAILRQLLTVTAHTHRENIVHRDLKPDNVLFEMNSDYADGEIGTIRVADFGLARVMGGVKRSTSHAELTETTAMSTVTPNGAVPTGNLGSVLYCAPEQEQGTDYDFKVDEFSIGMIAFEMWLAIAGKGFRDRFTIMNEVWRSGKLPGWFVSWNPTMAQVIGSLLELDPLKRRTCEDVLATAELPGDPADIIDALDTIDRYGERVVPRMLQKMQKLSNQYRKPPPTLRDAAQQLAAAVTTDFSQAVNLVGLLHGSASVSLYDSLIVTNPSLSEAGLEMLMDSAGRSFCYAASAQFAIASFLGMQDNTSLGPFHAFYRKTRSFAVFTSPMKHCDMFNESLLEPMLSFLHLLTFVDVASPVEVVVSHADWLNTVFPKEVGARTPPERLLNLRAAVDTPEKVKLAVSQVGEALASEGLAPSDERDELVRRFCVATMEAVSFFGRAIASHVVVVLDPALDPSDSLVSRNCLDKGTLFECRATGTHAASHVRTPTGSPAAPATCPVAFGCAMDNFVPLCTVANVDISGFSVVVEAEAFLSCWRHFHMPGKEGVTLDGVAIKRHDQYALTHLSSAVEAAVELWKGGVKAVLRMDSDNHTFSRFLKTKHLRYALIDGKRLASASSVQNKTLLKQPDIPPDQLRHAVRALMTEERAVIHQAQPEPEVVFITGDEDKRVAEEAREVFAAMEGQLKAPILVVEADSAEVERYLRDVASPAEPQGAGAPLLQWLRAKMSSLGIVPVFTTKDSKMLLFVNQRRFRADRKKDKGSGNKKKK